MMNAVAQKVTDWFLHIGAIEEQQKEWCVYTVEKRLTTGISLVFLILIGCMIAPFGTVILLNLSMIYLRPKVNGFHAKTFRGCLILSVIFETIALVLLPRLSESAIWITFGCSFVIILLMGPFNNKAIHYSEQEMLVVRKKMVIHLAIFCIVTAVLLFTFPNFAKSMVMALNTVAFLLILAKIGLGIQ